MQLTFLGGADEVGASCTLVEIAGKKILVDAGIRISPKSSRGLQDDQMPHLAHLSDVGAPDAILVTHAHTDHTGALPQLLRSFPRVPVYGTAATIALSRVLLLDSSRLMETRLDAEGELPLYDTEDVQRLLHNWQTLEVNKAFALGSDLQVTPYWSGHIAGAVMFVFESTEGVLVMGGDMSVSEQRTVVSCKPPRIRADALVLESTYGGRQHANRKFEERRLIDTLKQVTESGGKVLIPAFALGRAQEVIQILLAYQDEISIPVFADGMVRAVCDEYSSFSSILPKDTVKRAGNKQLFFRENVRAVRNREMRNELLHSSDPCIIVASSGMLTGGASVAYAAQLASDERNAIFLTGYQDAESPGRFLQNMMRRKDRGDTPILRMGKERVPLKCHLGTYSLSAHAAEAELVGIAEAMDAQRIFLVHGDADARHSLWNTLKGKGRMVARPRVGQQKSVEKRRNLVVRRDGEVAELGTVEKELDPEALWKMLSPHQGEEFTAREIAQVWYGDVEREQDVVEALEDDTHYFAQNWRNKKQFTVKKKWQVDKALLSTTLMRQNPDLAGKLIVMRNVNNQPRLAVVESISEDSFVATMQGSQAKNHSGDSFVWTIGEWTGDETENTKLLLNDFLNEAELIMERVIPFSKRKLLAAESAVVNPSEMVTQLPDPLPEGEAGETELRRYQVEVAAVALALARDGATHDEKGLKVERALPSGPVNQQVAREAAMNAFPPEARLRKVGMLTHKHTLILTFDFPQIARDKYRDSIEAVRMETGWEANVKMTVNQQALSEAVREVLPDGADIAKGPSLYMDKGEISAEITGATDEQLKAAEQAYVELTGFVLKLIPREPANTVDPSLLATADPVEQEPPVDVDEMPAASEPIEINDAYAVIRQIMEPKGMQKVGLKNGEIVLTFVSPQIGARYADELATLTAKTGYPIRLYENPMQNIILDRAKSLIRQAGWAVRKGPGIHTDRGEVSIKLMDDVPDPDIAALSSQLEESTGYRLVIR